ncbi:hypothetical protein [Pseudomonas sp. RIT-PI-AD]|uniref:hypothetical protein n=1 Tax=Pseudomonas sp. RIT-PI-AD TaxID=3035294 RepID=UPI0021D9E584|nr:hypothetical protein [Pseudomonas sp. RIT-PI-AD]
MTSLLLGLLFALPVSASEKVAQCQLGSAEKKQVEVLATHPISDTALYRLVRDGKADYLYADEDPEEDSRGSSVEIQCAGEDEQVLVLTGEFNSNFLQSVVLRFNSVWGAWERMDFAERAAPEWLYLGQDGMYVVVPNPGRNETPEPYLVYRFDSTKGQDYQAHVNEGPQGSDALPERPGYRAIHLKPRQPQP